MAKKRFDDNTDIAASFSLPGVEIYPNNRFGDIARRQGLETARNWRKVKEGTTEGMNDFASNITDGAVTAVSFSPFGGAVDAASIYNDLSNKNYASAGATAALALLPWGRIVRKSGSALRRQALKLPGYEEFERKAIEAAEKYGKDTWKRMQPYLYENQETVNEYNNAVEEALKAKDKYHNSKNEYDKSNELFFEYARKANDASENASKAYGYERKLREGKFSMADEWGFPYKGNPYRYNINAIDMNDIHEMDIESLYKKYGTSLFNPEDRKFINEMSKNGWDIRKVDFSKFSNKELRSIFNSNDKYAFKSIRSKEGIEKIKSFDDDTVEEFVNEIRQNIKLNAKKFNDFETSTMKVKLNRVDPRYTSNEDFIKAYNARIKETKKNSKLFLGDDGKIKFNSIIESENPGIYSGLNTGKNKIWDILGGRMYKYDISVPNSKTSISINGSFDAKDFSEFAKSGDIGDLKKISDISVIGDGKYFTPVVDKGYVDILRQNIEEVKRRIPGFKEFGSSVSASRMGLPHATDDIDGFMTKSDFVKKFGKEALEKMPRKRESHDGRAITYKYDLDVGNDVKLPIDINIVDEPENMGELIRQLEPDSYYNYMKNISKDKKNTVNMFGADYLISSGTGDSNAYNPDILLKKMDPESKTIADMFEIDFAGGKNGSKMKHKMRPIIMIANGDPEKVAKGMDTWAKGNFGPNIKQAPDMSEQFTDIERNKKMLQQMGYDYGGAEIDIAKNPKKMQNAFNYWYLSTTVRGRGVDPTGETPVYTMMTDWNPESIGGNANGAGLNTVTMGNSGYGQIYGYMQPDLKSDVFKTPEDIILNTNRSMGMPSYRITKDEADKINDIISRNVGTGKFTRVNEGDSPEEILNSIPLSGKGSDMVLNEIDKQLGFRSITRRKKFGKELYSSMTGSMRPEETVAIEYPRTASLYSRKLDSIGSYNAEAEMDDMFYRMRSDLNDMSLGIGRNYEIDNLRLKENNEYSQFDKNTEGSLLDMALSRKRRFAEIEHEKAKRQFENIKEKNNDAYKKYRNYDNEFSKKRNILDEKTFKLNFEKGKYNQGTRYVDYGIKSGLGLYGLYNLYDYMSDRAKSGRENNK